MGPWKSKLWTFVIGLVAGAAPFLCMSYLPHLLDPRAAVSQPDMGAVVIVGVLVGFVTLIMDAKRFSDEDPKEVLMRALAIPSILLATVTGLQSRQIVTEQRAAASTQTDSTFAPDVNISTAPGPSEMVGGAPAATGPSSWLWGSGAAWAQPRTTPLRRVAPALAIPGADYLVVLGQYSARAEAEGAAKRWQRTNALATERYYQKFIQVYTVQNKVFYVGYTAKLPRGEAIKLYKVLRINDPNVAPQIVQFPAAP